MSALSDQITKKLITELQQALLGLGYDPGFIDGAYGPQTHKAAMRAVHGEVGGNSRPPLAPAQTEGQSTIPDDYWSMLSKIESNDRPYIKASTSSASGLYQFIKSTWIGEGGKWGPDMSLAFGGLKPTPEEQLQRAKTFTERNANGLRRAQLPVNKASLYAAHFLGPSMAFKLIASDVNARADLIAGAAATNANPSILKGKTVGDFLTWLHKKTGAWAR